MKKLLLLLGIFPALCFGQIYNPPVTPNPFTAGITNSAAQTGVSIGTNAGFPDELYVLSTGATNEKFSDCLSIAHTFQCRFIDDVFGGAYTWLSVTKSGDFPIDVSIGAPLSLIGGATLISTGSALTNNAAAALGTLTNAPVAGNPTKWIAINDNGTVRYIPTW